MNRSIDYGNRKKSYLLYAGKSLKVNKRSYVILFISILCMVMMSSNLIIYNSSLSNGENEVIRREYGTYHAYFTGLGANKAHKAELSDHIKRYTEIKYITTINNPNKQSSLKTAKLAVYNEDMQDLQFEITEGELPGSGEIIINDTLSRAFNVYTGDEITFNLSYTDKIEDVTFKVSGIYKAAAATKYYVFMSEQMLSYMLEDKDETFYCSYDVYLTFNTSSRMMIKNYTSDIMSNLQISTNKNDTYQQQRAPYLNTNYVEMKQFYEKPLFFVTMLINIIPSAVAILVFILLDIFKFMKELSILSMIGTTPKQFFKMLALKYFYIYIIAFPCGLAVSAGLIGALCAFCDNMNYNENIYLKFYISPLAVILLFILCLIILTALTFYISKKTTAGTYAEMLSGTAKMNNIFVQKTSEKILQPGKRKEKLAALFFARNRKKNIMFTAVICVLAGVVTYFSIITSQQIGNIPVAADRGDYSVTGDSIRNSASSTIPDEALEELSDTNGVKRVIYSYYEYPGYDGNRPICYIHPAKTVSKPPSFHGAGTIQKQLNMPAEFFAEELDRAELLYGQFVVSGSLESLYDGTGKVAIFVHAWSDNEKYYRAGDTIDIKPAYEIDERTGELSPYPTYHTYEIGAVLFDRNDEYENVNIVRFLTSGKTFEEITYIKNPSEVQIVLEDGKYENDTSIIESIRDISKRYDLLYEDEHIVFYRQKSAMISSVAFYTILLSAIVFILVMMLTALSGFLLGSNEPTIKAMHMIGADKKLLFGIFGGESVITGIISASAGVIVSLLVVVVYTSFSNIISNVYTTGIIIGSMVFTAVISVIIPLLYSKLYFIREKYIK